jgi:hypothetical protein
MDGPMSVSQHAGRILEAWRRADAAAFEAEVKQALAACRSIEPASPLESEQRELLETVAERLDRAWQNAGLPPSAGTGLALLNHLCLRAAA